MNILKSPERSIEQTLAHDDRYLRPRDTQRPTGLRLESFRVSRDGDDELLQLPVILDRSNPATDKVIAHVDKLRNFHPGARAIFHPHEPFEKTIEAQHSEWERELDEAVFELYDRLYRLN